MAASRMLPSISTPVTNKEERTMALFEGYERKIDKINGVLAQYGLNSV